MKLYPMKCTENLILRALHFSDVTRIIVYSGMGEKMLEVPAWAGVVGAVAAPWPSVLGAMTALATDCTIKVVRRE